MSSLKLNLIFIFFTIFLICNCEAGFAKAPIQSVVDSAQKKVSENKEPIIVNNDIEGVKEKISNIFYSDKTEIILDGNFLFELRGTAELTAQERAEPINEKLEEFLEQVKKNQLIPRIKINNRHGLTVITINGEYLLTVTQDDLVESKQSSLFELAEFMKGKIEWGFKRAIKERSETYLPKAALKTVSIILITLILSLCITFLVRRILRERVALILVGLWIFALEKVLGIFPQTREWQYVIERGLLKPIFILLITAWIMVMLNRVAYWVINWYFRHNLPEGWSATNRKLNRALTLKKVAEATSNSVFIVFGLIVFLLLIGINIASVITGAGLLGLAFGFIAQDLIKDILNGLTILVEDQFGVGDVIRLPNFAGKVEDFSLRLTKLRNMEGALINIPNKKIDIVENLTSNFAQVDFQIGVDYSTDLERALAVMEQTASKLAKEWPDKVLQMPEILGVDKLNDSSITLRMLLKTLPMQQWTVLRELNLRIKKAFDEESIKIPFPQREIRVSSPQGEGNNLPLDFPVD